MPSRSKAHIEFVAMVAPGKTGVWEVRTTANGVVLGTVKWFPAWRRYCLFAAGADFTVWDAECLRLVADFMAARMAERG